MFAVDWGCTRNVECSLQALHGMRVESADGKSKGVYVHCSWQPNMSTTSWSQTHEGSTDYAVANKFGSHFSRESEANDDVSISEVREHIFGARVTDCHCGIHGLQDLRHRHAHDVGPARCSMLTTKCRQCRSQKLCKWGKPIFWKRQHDRINKNIQNQQHKAHRPFNLKPHFVKLFSFNCTCPAPPHFCRRLPHYCVEATRRNLLACREPRTLHQTASRPELDPMGLGGSWAYKTRSLSTWCFLGNQGTFRAKPLCTTDGSSGECGKWWKSSFHAEVADLNAIDATETSTLMDAARFSRKGGIQHQSG